MEATLKLFEINTTTHNSLIYDRAVNVTFPNPNRRIGYYYDRVEGRADCGGKRFAAAKLALFDQGHKNTTVIGSVFQGQHTVGAKEMKKFDEERNDRVEVDWKGRAKVGLFKGFRFPFKRQCHIKVPLGSSNGTRGPPFQPTTCLPY